MPTFFGPDRNGLFVFRRKHSHFFQFLFHCQKPLVQKSGALQGDFSGIELVLTVSFVNADAAAGHHLIPVFHGKAQTFPLARNMTQEIVPLSSFREK